jgi:hypothetical protein
MQHYCNQLLRALEITTALLFSVHAYADDDVPKPTSAGDIGGNIKSFFGNLGKGVAVRKPYEEYDVVSRGIVPGRGPGYCLKGEPMPHLESASNQVSLAVIPCKTLEETGQFQRVTKAATATASPSGAAGSTDRQFVDTSNTCTYHLVPTSDGTGDQWCMVKDGRVIGRSHYTMNKTTGQYDETFTRLKEPVNIGVLKAGGGVDSNGKVTLPANVQAGWDNVDRIQREGTARIQAESAARESANADKSMMRKAAFEKCKPLISSDNSQMDAFKACVKNATK